ncbi:hypothetical protein [Albibacterium profundi]|uniref:Uncharacterized protein n=1 Tax=Albibacterium profundi TaxID=3134906 RepID=A0ABV5CFR1_9SPHI
MKKRLFILTLFLVLGITSVFAQRIYVEKTDNGYEQPIVDKLISEGFQITFKQDSADYIVKCIIGKTGMGRAKGSVAIIDNKSGDLLAKTKEVNGQTAITNGYANPKMVAMKKIADKYLIDLVRKYCKVK